MYADNGYFLYCTRQLVAYQFCCMSFLQAKHVGMFGIKPLVNCWAVVMKLSLVL